MKGPWIVPLKNVASDGTTNKRAGGYLHDQANVARPTPYSIRQPAPVLQRCEKRRDNNGTPRVPVGSLML